MMSADEVTTIAALATAPMPSGIAVIRVSGPKVRVVLRSLFRSKKSCVEHPREMIFGRLLDFHTGAEIDDALAVYMPGPHSFTGEDVAEFQFHGSPLLVEKMLRSLFAFGAVPAEAGEFTKRAFLNGKLDLVQAEAIGDLINASSERALKVAGEQLRGRLSSAIESVGEPLRDTLAEIEANIDFPDEDIEPKKVAQLREVILQARNRVVELLGSYSYGAVIREGFRVLLCGRPNAGKSSLLNLFLGRPRAIVSDVSGTTRDLIEENAILDGFKFVFCDSAGITETTDKVEKIGIELAKERMSWADLVLLVVDATDTDDSWQVTLGHLKGRAKNIWLVVNKIDLNSKAMEKFYCDSSICSRNFYLSAQTKAGFSALTDALVEQIKSSSTGAEDSSSVVTNERQKSCLVRAKEAMDRCISGVDQGLPLELVSAELRVALSALEEIVGKTHTEDILGRIFSKFCIGK